MPTTPKPGQWNPNYKPSTTSVKPPTTQPLQTSTQISASTTESPLAPLGHPEDAPPSGSFNEIDYSGTKCIGDYMSHVECDKVRLS